MKIISDTIISLIYRCLNLSKRKTFQKGGGGRKYFGYNCKIKNEKLLKRADKTFGEKRYPFIKYVKETVKTAVKMKVNPYLPVTRIITYAR